MGLSRSEQMSRIRGEDTSPERVLGAALRERGLDFDEHAKTPVGRPDIVFSTLRVAVFIDGCFWHGCPTTTSARARGRSSGPPSSSRTRRPRSHADARPRSCWAGAWCGSWEHEVFTALDEVIGAHRRAPRTAATENTTMRGACFASTCSTPTPTSSAATWSPCGTPAEMVVDDEALHDEVEGASPRSDRTASQSTEARRSSGDAGSRSRRAHEVRKR